MKKFKLVLWLIIIVFLGLFFYQNKTFFMTRHALSFKFPFAAMYPLPEVPTAIICLACLLFGLLVAYFFQFIGTLQIQQKPSRA